MNKQVLKSKGSSAVAFMPMPYSIDCSAKSFSKSNSFEKSEGVKDDIISEEELLQFLWKS